jgi:hypothetical protein
LPKAGPNKLRFAVSRAVLGHSPNVLPVQALANRFPEA